MATTENRVENIDDIDEVEKIFKNAAERTRQQNANAQRIQEDNDRKDQEDQEQKRRDAEIKQAKDDRKKRKKRACFVLACVIIIAAFGCIFAAVTGMMSLFNMNSTMLVTVAGVLGAIIMLFYKGIYDYLKKEICSNK